MILGCPLRKKSITIIGFGGGIMLFLDQIKIKIKINRIKHWQSCVSNAKLLTFDKLNTKTLLHKACQIPNILQYSSIIRIVR